MVRCLYLQYFEDIEYDSIYGGARGPARYLTPELKKLVIDGVIKVIQVTEDKDIEPRRTMCMNIKLRIKGIQDLVELRYLTIYSTQHRRIKLDGQIYEFGIGDYVFFYNEYCGKPKCFRNKNCTCLNTRDCLAESIYILRKLHTILNIDYSQTAVMIHLLFGFWSYYPYIKDEIQSLEELIKIRESSPQTPDDSDFL